MTVLAPGFLLAGILTALGAVLLHLIMHRTPPAAPFPTARFIPPGVARAARAAVRPNDLLLLALRVATVLLAAAALARPVTRPDRTTTARILLLDASRAAASFAEVRDSARALLSDGDLVVVFDSTASVSDTLSDSTPPPGATRAMRGNLSAGLVAAMQAAPAVRDRADSVELVVVSPLLREEMDAATLAIRERWPGRVRLVPVAADTASRDAPGAVELAATAPNDPLAAAVARLGRAAGTASVRIIREAPTSDDSVWVREGGVLIRWPRPGPDEGGAPDESQPANGAPTTVRQAANTPGVRAADSIGGVLARGALVVAPFARSGSGAPGGENPDAAPIAWWADGRPAAAEQRLGTGCIREVEVQLPARGDLVLRDSFRRLLSSLTSPCGGGRDAGSVPERDLKALAGQGGLAPASSLHSPARSSPYTPWLIASALLLALVEPAVRRRQAAA